MRLAALSLFWATVAVLSSCQQSAAGEGEAEGEGEGGEGEGASEGEGAGEGEGEGEGTSTIVVAVARIKTINNAPANLQSPPIIASDDVVVSADHSTTSAGVIVGTAWTITSAPPSSVVQLSSPAAPDTGFVFTGAAGPTSGLDVAGTYTLSLVVTATDGTSAATTKTIEVHDAGSCEAPFPAVLGENDGVIPLTSDAEGCTGPAFASASQTWTFAADHDLTLKLTGTGAGDFRTAFDSCPISCNSTQVATVLAGQSATIRAEIDANEPGVPVEGAYSLQLTEVLQEGAACDPSDANHICAATDLCFSGSCTSQVTAVCDGEVDVSAGLVHLGPGLPTHDLECRGGDTNEQALHYVTGSVLANVVFDFPAGDSGSVQVRDSCTDSSSIVACPDTIDVDDGNGSFHERVVVSFVPPQTALAFLVSSTATDVNVSELPSLAVDEACPLGDSAQPCPEPTLCLGVPGAETCTTDQPLAVDDVCVAADTAHFCPSEAPCAVDVDGLQRCINKPTRVCSGATPAVVGATVGDVLTAFNGLFLLCSEPPLGPDVAFTYVVTGSDVRLDASVHSVNANATDAWVVAVRTGCTNPNDEVACGAAGRTGALHLHAGDVVTVIVEDTALDQGRFELDLAEDEITTGTSGDICNDKETELCGAGLTCLGGPRPRDFRCLAAASFHALDEACVDASTDEICDARASLACIADVCAPAAAASTTTLDASTGSPIGIAVSAKPFVSGSICAAVAAPGVGVAWHIENTSSSDAQVSVRSTGLVGSDTVGFYVPGIDPAFPTDGCALLNDSFSVPPFALAAGAQADVVFDATVDPDEVTFTSLTQGGGPAPLIILPR